MLKKRLVAVVTVRNGWAVQSIGYRRYLPLGLPECLVENLDRWGADEILVQVIDRSTPARGPDFELIERIARIGLGTPLIYGGGIRTAEDGVQAIQRGADRIVVDALLHDDLSVVGELSARLGTQALIASLPVSTDAQGLARYDYRKRISKPLDAAGFAAIRGIVSEVLFIDWRHEGVPAAFDFALLHHVPDRGMPLIIFGGISEAQQVQALMERPNVAAVAIGNFLSYREHAIQRLRAALASASLRPARYATEHSLRING